jgi:glycerophosphoryl diester phosphodiesterase
VTELLRGTRAVVVLGHRGAPALAAENTLPSFAAAIELGVDGVEMDVRARASGELVLAHEAPGDGAATLDEALELVAAHDVLVQLDLKGRGHESAVAAALRRHALVDRSFVSTPVPASLHALAAAAPEVARALTYPDDRLRLSLRPVIRHALLPALAAMRSLLPQRLPRLLGRVGAAAATLDWRVVTEAAVEACHREGIAVYAWTVDDPDAARTLAGWGIDGIITNDPRLFHGRSSPDD